jgi:hypothetical protein
MLNLNLNILGASNKPIVPIAPDPIPTTTTTTTTTTTSTTTTSTTTTTTFGPASFRNDPLSASLLFATPGNQFGSLGMSLSYSDVHADIAGVGSNLNVNTGSFADATYTNFAGNGYTTSTRTSNTSSFYNQNDSDFQFTTQNFTIETWINFGAGGVVNKNIYADYSPGAPANSSVWTNIDNSRIRFIVNTSTVTEAVVQTGGLSWNVEQWYHLAFVKNGTTYTIYRDGVSVASTGVGGTLNITTRPKIIVGGPFGGTDQVWLQDYRIYKGVAKYTSDFTPPPSMVL